jgi:hypothetical protein
MLTVEGFAGLSGVDGAQQTIVRRGFTVVLR